MRAVFRMVAVPFTFPERENQKIITKITKNVEKKSVKLLEWCYVNYR